MPYVRYEVVDRVGFVRLNRPDRLNAYGLELRWDLARAFEAFDADPDAEVAIICGEGSSFCAGRDLKEEHEGAGGTRPLDTDIPPPEMLNRLHVRDTQKPLIAAVHGYAIGAGFGITLGCDYRIASSDARFAYTEVATGLPGPWDLAILQVVPWAIASEIALLGRRLSAQRLYEVGLINEVVEPGQHEARAREVAAEFLQQPQDMLRYTKELMMLGRPKPPAEATARRRAIGEELQRNASRLTAIEQFAEHRTQHSADQGTQESSHP